ncbi:hypothetical protein TSAR_012814 [Trichomalopsis sarcophagae]|uniref:Uncharacterized protein n=1 Tax=Trichomalopsis sarcophagae TaxID=543379 RepID=A0A232F3V8_9HYME|nr:hypothetical protein TSAR_012814 [Trichomalopsis sarcophagae]
MPRVTKGGRYSGDGPREQLDGSCSLLSERGAPNLASVVGDLPARWPVAVRVCYLLRAKVLHRQLWAAQHSAGVRCCATGLRP